MASQTNDGTGHQDIEDAAIDQHNIDATLAENGFSAFSTASRYTYQKIEESSLTSPLKTLAWNASRVKTASVQRQQTKAANLLSGQAQQLYRYLVEHKDIAADIHGPEEDAAFDRGQAPWFVHLLHANANGIPPHHWQMEAPQFREVIDLYVPLPPPLKSLLPFAKSDCDRSNVGNGEADEPSEASANPLVIQKSVSNAADGRAEYFLINTKHNNLKVHGEEIGAPSIAGPLPSFAIIECGKKAIFFFRDQDGLNHPNKASSVKKVSVPSLFGLLQKLTVA